MGEFKETLAVEQRAFPLGPEHARADGVSWMVSQWAF